MRRATLALTLCSSFVPACTLPNEACERGEQTAQQPQDDDGGEQRFVRVAEVLPGASSSIDILFVIDDSISMTDEQDQLGMWANELFGVLSFAGELPDLHVAVISSSLSVPGLKGCTDGGDGRFHIGQADLGGDRFLRDIAGEQDRLRNFAGPLNETFAKMARVGDVGCGYEQPFEATRRALSGEIAGNDGFLRDDALLLVVFVSDEDDCSAIDSSVLTADAYGDVCSPLGARTSYRCFEFGVQCDDGKSARELGPRSNCRSDEESPYIAPVSPFADFLKGLKDHPGKVIVAGVYGVPESVDVVSDPRLSSGTPMLAKVCESSLGSATPAIRIEALLSQFPARAARSSICESDLSWAMRNTALVTRRVATRSHCLAGSLADTDSSVVGLQPTCQVATVTAAGTSLASSQKLRPCASATDDNCYAIEADTTSCADTASKLAVRVRQPNRLANETLTVSCELAAGL
jgi:hypothetical protein